MEILVFRTGVKDPVHIGEVAPHLNSLSGIYKWNFDLDDTDNILRVESAGISPRQIESVLEGMNYYCEELPD
ncbi:MAG TPA: hypothetical protein PK605_01220 [Ignavibacteria bacterium]|nr:hypothetical protein [Ignavibacteria bacterium]HAX48848.1 hypothetical protein [Bacteroidota bacterium]HRE09771.1 hypothetical protein [Ignavibacteria bacterium]HRF65504.1 hypothetical protein [Ignavibacteria bacterium]HRJ03001.1 hypothetical protein [Ignavibacteria bacterium]